MSLPTFDSMNDPADIDPTTLGAHPDPARQLDELVTRLPYGLADGRWVVARRADVEAVLASADVRVVAPAAPPRVGSVLSQMARFTDGPDHAARRRAIEALLAGLEPDTLRAAARDDARLTLESLAEIEVVELARRVPVMTLARMLHLDDPDGTAASVLSLLDEIGRDRDDPVDADAIEKASRTDPAVLAILFQTVDATAASIIAQLLDPPSASIVLTTRVTTAPLSVGGRTIPADATILVVLAAAARSDLAFAFGAGPHRCPGSSLATALADGVTEAVREWTGSSTLLPPTRWQDRPNLRLPIELVAHRA